MPPAPRVEIDEKAAAERLAGAIPIRTVSGMEGLQSDGQAFKELHAYLAQQFPKLHATLKKEVVGNNALLYTWTGSDPTARPIALMAHQDVVPIAPGTEKAWASEPFSGQIKDGFVWGRGTWDNKGNLLAQMEPSRCCLRVAFSRARPSTWSPATTRRSAACAVPSRSPNC